MRHLIEDSHCLRVLAGMISKSRSKSENVSCSDFCVPASMHGRLCLNPLKPCPCLCLKLEAYVLHAISLLTLLCRVVTETVHHVDPKQGIWAWRAWPGHARARRVCIMAMPSPEDVYAAVEAWFSVRIYMIYSYHNIPLCEPLQRIRFYSDFHIPYN